MRAIFSLGALAAAVVLAGCGASAPKLQRVSFPVSQRAQIGYASDVVPNHSPHIYMLVSPQGQRWKIDSVFASLPQRSHAGQEILVTNEDLHTWVFPLRSAVDHCPTHNQPRLSDTYSLCNSALGEKTGLGNAILIAGSAGTHPTRQYTINYQLARAIVNSIPQAEVEAQIQPLLLRRQQRAQEQAEYQQQQREQQQAAEREKQRLAEQAYWNEVRAETKRQQEAFARRKVQEEKLIAEARKHPVGTEDRCLYKGELRAMGYGAEPLQCTFTTLDNTDLLARAGWIIVNSQTNSYGNVVAYVIRKVR